MGAGGGDTDLGELLSSELFFIISGTGTFGIRVRRFLRIDENIAFSYWEKNAKSKL
jgi:hypothetical protein